MLKFILQQYLQPLIAPAGLLVLTWAALNSSHDATPWLTAFFETYPYVAFTTALLLGWSFHRSRVVFALAILALSDRALIVLAGGEGEEAVRALVFQCVALLLPFNLLLLSLIGERGILTFAGLLRLAVVLLQVALVGAAVRYHWSVPPQLLALPWETVAWASSTPVPHLALTAFGFSLIALIIRYLREPSPIEAGLLGMLVAAFLALHVDAPGQATTIYFATGSLILAVAVVVTSHSLAFRDGLTRLPSRRALEETLPTLGGRYAIAMVDIDHFKRVNDAYGHSVGDQVLRMIASRMSQVAGGGRSFRYGGEEFAIIFRGSSMEEALPRLERLCEAIENTSFVVRGPMRPKRKPKKGEPRPAPGTQQLSVTISVGVAQRSDEAPDPYQVLMAADRALYRAKHAGRNCLKRA